MKRVSDRLRLYFPEDVSFEVETGSGRTGGPARAGDKLGERGAQPGLAVFYLDILSGINAGDSHLR